MGKWRWWPKESGLDTGGMTTFRRQLLLFLSLVTFQGAWFLVPWAVNPPGPTSTEVAAIALGLLLGGITFFLRVRWPVMASWVYAWGSLLFSTVLILAFPTHTLLVLPALSAMVSGLLLGPLSGVLTGIPASLIVLAVGSHTAAADAATFWMIITVVADGIGIIAGHALAQVDYWERALVMEQWQHIEKLRERQGELNRALKAYDDACARLNRSNEELSIARRLAEEALASKERFVASVSHELRTPLNIIVGFAEQMYLFPESYVGVTWSPELEGDVQELYRAARHLQSLIDDVLDLARIDAARLPMFREWCDLREIIDQAHEVIAPLLDKRGLGYKVECPARLPRLFLDRTRIRQVLINLLSNAARYTDQGGIKVQITVNSHSVTVAVHDTGVGIPPDQLEDIFREFSQVDRGLNGRGGTGLGLALSRRFVAAHGGHMWAESEPGKGSTFYFSLPLPGIAVSGQATRRLPGRRADTGDAPLVVIDPDPSLADMLSRHLGERVVIGARDEQEADSLVQREHPLAVIVNLPPDAPPAKWTSPPKGTIREFNVPLLRCSIPSPSWLRYTAGFDRCLTKPVSRAALQELVNECPSPASVLVVDDDPGFVRLAVRILKSLENVGRVRSAYSGEHALRLAREMQPDLVLLDLLMADMDGFQVLRALRSLPEAHNSRVVAVTATDYGEEALPPRSPYFTLTWERGLDTATLIKLLSGVLEHVRADYAAVDTSFSKA